MKYPCVQVGMQDVDHRQFTSAAHAVGFWNEVHFSPQVAVVAVHAQPDVAWQVVEEVAVVPHEAWHVLEALSYRQLGFRRQSAWLREALQVS